MTKLTNLLGALGAPALGWLLGGWAGGAAAIATVFVAQLRPRLAPFVAFGLLVATAVATLVEGDLGGSPVTSFARERPVAHTLGICAATAWLAAAMMAGRRDTPSSSATSSASDPTETVTADESSDAPTSLGGARQPGPSAGAHPELVPAAMLLAVGAAGWIVGLWPDTMFFVFVWLSLVAGVVGRRLMTWLSTIAGRLRRQEGERALLTGSAWLVSGTAVISIGSFLYWLIAARIAEKGAVGNASAMFTACFLLSLLASPGLVTMVSRYGSEPRAAPTAIYAWSLLVSVAGSVVVSIAFVLVGPSRVDDALEGLHPATAAVLLTFLVAGLSVSALADIRLMGRREWKWLFARHASITIIRLVGLAVIDAGESGRGLFILAVGAFAVTGLPFLPVSLLQETGWPRLRDIRGHQTEVVRYAATNALGQLAIQGTALLAPLTALAWITSDEFADLYIAWGIMSVVFAGIQLVTQILLVEGSRGKANRSDQIRTTLQVTAGGALAATLAAVPFQALVPSLYGDDFASAARLILPLMAGTVPWALTSVALTSARLRADHRQSIVLALVFAVSVIGAVIGGTVVAGTFGAALGWLLGGVLAAAFAWREVASVARRAEPEPDPASTPDAVIAELVQEAAPADAG